MLTVGDRFPSYDLKAVVSADIKTAFTQLTDQSHEGKWKVVFFWPKDFTFVCPTEILAFGAIEKAFAERDAVLIGASIDTEFVHGVAQFGLANRAEPFGVVETGNAALAGFAAGGADHRHLDAALDCGAHETGGGERLVIRMGKDEKEWTAQPRTPASTKTCSSRD